MNHCTTKKYCAECKDSDTCHSDKGYCETMRYCEECGECNEQ